MGKGYGVSVAPVDHMLAPTVSNNHIRVYLITYANASLYRDEVTFDPNQQASTRCISGDCPNGSSAAFSLGPTYFEGFKRFQNAQMTFQAPLGKNPVNISNTLDYVRRAYNALGPDRVAAIAVGNEPGVYDKTADAYLTGALEVEGNITDALKLGSNATIFEVLDLSSGSVINQKPFTL